MLTGTDAALDVWRAGKKQTVPVKVTELKEQTQQAKLGGKQKEHATNQASQFGLTVRPLDPQLAAELQASPDLALPIDAVATLPVDPTAVLPSVSPVVTPSVAPVVTPSVTPVVTPSVTPVVTPSVTPTLP